MAWQLRSVFSRDELGKSPVLKPWNHKYFQLHKKAANHFSLCSIWGSMGYHYIILSSFSNNSKIIQIEQNPESNSWQERKMSD